MVHMVGTRPLGALRRECSNQTLNRRACSAQRARPRAKTCRARASVEGGMLSALLGAAVKRQQKDVSELVQMAGAKGFFAAIVNRTKPVATVNTRNVCCGADKAGLVSVHLGSW